MPHLVNVDAAVEPDLRRDVYRVAAWANIRVDCVASLGFPGTVLRLRWRPLLTRLTVPVCVAAVFTAAIIRTPLCRNTVKRH